MNLLKYIFVFCQKYQNYIFNKVSWSELREVVNDY